MKDIKEGYQGKKGGRKDIKGGKGGYQGGGKKDTKEGKEGYEIKGRKDIKE